jgi:lipopolysaccharide export LptBFGC system permease protein LptF
MASPHHRHQSSLEGVLDFSSPQPLQPDQRNRATDIFNQIVAQYEPSQTDSKGYKRITLLRVVHDSVISRDNFLSCFFLFVENELHQGDDVSELSLSQALSRYVNLDSWSRQQRKELETSLITFSDYLVDNFFLPRTIYIPYVIWKC